MGLKDLVTRDRSEPTSRSALEAAGDAHPDHGAIDRMVTMLLDVGLDGRGPLDPVREVAAEALRKAGGDRDKAIAAVARRTTFTGGVGGFVTGVGGYVTMPVALPVNVAEFYLQAVRMVGAVAVLRGYDVDDPRVRSAILLVLVGAEADEVLTKLGMSSVSSRATTYALGGLPPAALMMINKAVGFRLMRGVGEKTLAGFGRGIPIAGGLVGAGLDGFMMKKIADHAMAELPAT
ncbi:EcsC family protein [Nocardioides sp. STR2]|uniref:EcsC family protein n=1 Tax=Nocardioides pini TaxID=2975053 RepID=A0ABT4CH36_9ACTN|nr:EcsC family protein [Nocardioides pini]MCY4728250.1 EcsC family protein [Nocardioides pini]